MFPLVEGQTLLGDGGRYRFLSRLASGTFAIILRAVDSQSDRVVAVKCILEPALNAIGEREAALLKALNARDANSHVAVVRLLDCFTHRSHFCLVLELLGETIAHVGTLASHSGRVLPWRQARPPPFLLNDRTGEPQHKLLALVYKRHQKAEAKETTEESGDDEEDEEEEEEEDEGRKAVEQKKETLPLHEIRQMAVHLCAALAFVHDQGLVHADLKPENIVRTVEVDQSGGPLAAIVKLVDFGNCIEKRQLPLYEADDAADQSGGFDIQTLAYRAPEVAMGVVIAPAMDMWSLGCVLVESATGESLFGEPAATDAVDLVDQIQWLLTGGVALRKSKAEVYTDARYYQTQAKGPRASSGGVSSTSVARRLPLRHRLEVSRPKSTSETEWLEFQDFAERLLEIDPSVRLSARAAFVHPFLQRVFPFQFVFAPGLSVTATEDIDTSPPEEEEAEAEDEAAGSDQQKKSKKRSKGDASSVAKRRRPHVSSSLKHALQLIPKVPAAKVKKEPKWV